MNADQSSDEPRETLRALLEAGRSVVEKLPDPTGSENPVELLRAWHDTAEGAGLLLPEGMALATVSPEGEPSVRMVLLKGLDERGLRFFTNYESAKARDLEATGTAAVCFHWAVLERQVRVHGSVERLTKLESFEYFKSRPRGSRIGAWASRQSRPLDERETLLERVERFERKFEGEEIPLPPHWGGYRLVPDRFEFWQGRESRLHDRWVFHRVGGDGWKVERLQP